MFTSGYGVALSLFMLVLLDAARGRATLFDACAHFCAGKVARENFLPYSLWRAIVYCELEQNDRLLCIGFAWLRNQRAVSVITFKSIRHTFDFSFLKRELLRWSKVPERLLLLAVSGLKKATNG